MKNLSKMLVFLFISVVLFQAGGELSAQPGPQSIKRIQQVKKMKLLDELNLDEKTADRFLIKYSAWEDKVNEKKEAIDIARKELDLAVQKKEDKSALTQKSNKFLEAMAEMGKTLQDKNIDMRNVLTEEQYAKFLIFEDRFMHDLQKTMFRMMKKGDMPPPDFDGGHHPRPRKPKK